MHANQKLESSSRFVWRKMVNFAVNGHWELRIKRSDYTKVKSSAMLICFTIICWNKHALITTYCNITNPCYDQLHLPIKADLRDTTTARNHQTLRGKKEENLESQIVIAKSIPSEKLISPFWPVLHSGSNDYTSKGCNHCSEDGTTSRYAIFAKMITPLTLLLFMQDH